MENKLFVFSECNEWIQDHIIHFEHFGYLNCNNLQKDLYNNNRILKYVKEKNIYINVTRKEFFDEIKSMVKFECIETTQDLIDFWDKIK